MGSDRPGRPHIVHVAPRDLVGRPRPSAPPSAALLPGAVAALALLAVVVPVPDDWALAFGTAHWMVRVFAAAAVAVLAWGLASPNAAVVAALLAALGAISGFGEYLSDDPSGRDTAPLAAGLCCTAATLLCLPLVKRTDPWLGLDTAPLRSGRALRRRARRLGVLALVGALLGGLLGTGAFLFAYERRTEYGPKPPHTESQPVPDAERDKGAAEEDADLPRTLAREAWHRTFPNPVGLSVCGDGRRDADRETYGTGDAAGIRGTLVSVESASPGSAVFGLDAATGRSRWRFTVRDPGGVQQVAVSEGCAVLVIHGVWLTVLDSYDGSVRGRSELPGTGMLGQPDRWRFITSAAQGDHPPQVVTLPAAQLAYVGSPGSGVLAVDRKDAAIVGRVAERDSYCRYLVHQGSPGDPGTLVISGCAEGQFSVLDLAEPPRADSSLDLPPLLAGRRIELTVPPPRACVEGWTATSLDVTHRRVLTVEDECGSGRTWVGDIGLEYGRTAPVTWTSAPVVPSTSAVPPGRPGIVSGLNAVLLLPAPDGIRLIGRDERKGHDLYRLRKGETASSIVAFTPPQVDIYREAYFLVLTDAGRIGLLRQEFAETRSRTRLVEQGDLKAPQVPCPGTGTLWRDRASGTVLAVCGRTSTTVRALRP
ncbi:hypothetical protein H9Y04_32090 [Streptomyces sp. TRM66268-LWL]|uniref:PQQ-binding-like beta-propeller repeat protein n=1 Tax=Streptomyces polyasparticus TaxID=2767826 RepID=A0ABR7SNX3_9ACTN|nr:hypothetical protein [Streptomyces polyasparticus]MBC9717180.1 hypothetical protein [Streptomyces polyasparticus]